MPADARRDFAVKTESRQRTVQCDAQECVALFAFSSARDRGRKIVGNGLDRAEQNAHCVLFCLASS